MNVVIKVWHRKDHFNTFVHKKDKDCYTLPDWLRVPPTCQNQICHTYNSVHDIILSQCF